MHSSSSSSKKYQKKRKSHEGIGFFILKILKNSEKAFVAFKNSF